MCAALFFHFNGFQYWSYSCDHSHDQHGARLLEATRQQKKSHLFGFLLRNWENKRNKECVGHFLNAPRRF